jgi:sulfur carrier protein
VKVRVNGEEREVPADATVAALIRALGLAERVAVERNGRLVPRGEHERTRLADGDRLEIVTLVGGG